VDGGTSRGRTAEAGTTPPVMWSLCGTALSRLLQTREATHASVSGAASDCLSFCTGAISMLVAQSLKPQHLRSASDQTTAGPWVLILRHHSTLKHTCSGDCNNLTSTLLQSVHKGIAELESQSTSTMQNGLLIRSGIKVIAIYVRTIPLA
jgi:hypothetical protein